MTRPAKVLNYCPRCGSSGFKAESFKSFLCESCNFHFYINSAAAVAALIENEKGELLLTVRGEEPKKGMLDLPGGFVDPNERAEDALKREIMEELNLEIDSFQYLTSYPNEYVFSGYSVYTTDLGFVCKISDFSGILYRDDITGFLFVKPEELDYDRICSASICQIIKVYIEAKQTQED
jgi:NAD+ diphosphatase